MNTTASPLPSDKDDLRDKGDALAGTIETAADTTVKKKNDDARDREFDRDDEEEESESSQSLLALKRGKSFDKLISTIPWINKAPLIKNSASISARDYFIRTASVACICCKNHGNFVEVNGNDPSNVSKHEGTRHNENWSNHGQAAHLNLLLAKQRQKVLDQPLIQRRKDAAQGLRKVTAAVIVGGGTNPHQVERIFGVKSSIPEALEVLRSASMSFGACTTIRSDLKDISLQVKELIKKRVKLTTGALVIDGATLNHEHGMGVGYLSAYLPEPLFLGMIFAEEDPDAEDGWSYPATRCSDDIKIMLNEYGIATKQIVCLMGDNVTFNDKVAEILGLERGKCIAHALSLTVKKSVLSLPGFKELVVTSSGILYAGGSSSRAAALRKLGVDPKTIYVYPNRFGSVLGPAAARLENFEILKDFHLNEDIFPISGNLVEQGFIDIEDNDSSINKAKKCAKAHQSPSAKVVLAICGVIFESVPKLIMEASSDSGHLPHDFTNHLRIYKRHLKACVQAPESVTQQAKHRAYPTDHVVKKTTAFRNAEEALNKIADDLIPYVKTAATIALDSFDKHIEPMLRFFDKGALYNVNTPVLSMPSNITKEVIGCFVADFGPAKIGEFIDYQEDVMRLMSEDKKKPPIWTAQEWDDHTPKERDAHIDGRWGYLSASRYWIDKLPKERNPKLPSLAEIALWHLSFPTSSIFIERIFAKMRMMGVPQRLKSDNETFARELLFRGNPTLMEELLKKSIEAYEDIS